MISMYSQIVPSRPMLVLGFSVASLSAISAGPDRA